MKPIKSMMMFLALILAAGMAPACSCGDDEGGDGDGDIDAGDGDGDDAFPDDVGAQIDRAGRSAVSTALIESLLFADAPSQGAGKDAYNADANVAGWVAAHTAEIHKNIAVLDSLDATGGGGGTNGCGNQFGFDGGGATDYDFLAGALADDRLLIDPSTTTCTQYLALEAGVAGDCGGRTPLYDTVGVTYSALAIGALVGVTSGVAADLDGAGVAVPHSTTAFPYLAAPVSN